ncbi:DDI2 [Cordylochernes scorpioides]|uniref:DDI2 n=1 Tax=Cordylochernes scorpioides TaxID=51811 RepID=A0ABY6L020_9ARAC|nr:DDI2 [Cordylochernes scorpioides]
MVELSELSYYRYCRITTSLSWQAFQSSLILAVISVMGSCGNCWASWGRSSLRYSRVRWRIGEQPSDMKANCETSRITGGDTGTHFINFRKETEVIQERAFSQVGKVGGRRQLEVAIGGAHVEGTAQSPGVYKASQLCGDITLSEFKVYIHKLGNPSLGAVNYQKYKIVRYKEVYKPFSHASECEKLSGAASNGGEVAIEENPPGYIAAKLKENFVMVEINGRKIKALVDSGADFSVISDKFRRELKTPLFKEPGPILKAANKNLIETIGKCVLNIEVNGLNISFEFVVMVECSHDIIFGWDFFKATEAVIDCGRNELHLGETSVLESREEENQRLFASDDFVIPPKSIKKISVINEEICGVRDVLVSTSKVYY